MTATPDFFAPARARPQLWRLLLGLLVIVACSFLWIGVLLGAAWLLDDRPQVLSLARELERPDTPRATLILLATFTGMALGPALAVWLIHARRPSTLIGPLRRAARHFAASAGIVLAIYGCGVAAWLATYVPEANLTLSAWTLLLPLGLVGVAVQTGAEELVFRGYLVQQLGARFRSLAIWLVVPALVFGAVHYNPATTGGNALLVVGSAALFGLAAADLTLRTGSLGAAWGFHFANNVIAILVLATQGTITGLALFVTPYGADDPSIFRQLVLGDLALLLLAWALVRQALRP